MYESIALTLREHRRHHPEACDLLDEVASEIATLAEDPNEFLVTCEHPDGNPFTRVVAERGPVAEPEPADDLAEVLSKFRGESPKVIDELSEKIGRSLAKVSGDLDQAKFLMKAGAKPKQTHQPTHGGKRSGKRR